MGKYMTLAIIVLVVLSFAACSNRAIVLGTPKIFDVPSEIHSLDIQINAADFTIVRSDHFCVESNLKNLTVSEKNGVLMIEEKSKVSTNYADAMLTLYVPANISFEEIKIKTGAARLVADPLSANSLILKLGAGQVQFDSLSASSSIDIEGGAGEITIADGTLHNMKLSLGVGQFEMTAALLGKSDLQFGIGETKLTLIGSPAEYNLDVTKGIGSIKIDNSTGINYSSGNAHNRVKIQGGIGAANITFQE